MLKLYHWSDENAIRKLSALSLLSKSYAKYAGNQKSARFKDFAKKIKRIGLLYSYLFSTIMYSQDYQTHRLL